MRSYPLGKAARPGPQQAQEGPRIAQEARKSLQEALGSFEKTELTRTGAVDVYLIDEVGKMELFCPAFVEAVPRLLDSAVPAVLTVAQKGPGLIAQVKARADVRLMTVMEETRDGLPEELEHWVRDRLRVP